MWKKFAQQESLTRNQVEKFEHYFSLLSSWNATTNLTTITEQQKVIWYHFQDSLMVRRVVDMDVITTSIDVGSGAGFPGIPLAIAYPEKMFILIEVNHKKVSFLQEVITQLELSNVMISDYDWRTFLRKTTYEAQLICARASLQPKELVRAFQSSSAYNKATLVYWASSMWQITKDVKPFFVHSELYKVGARSRRLIILKNRPQ